VQDLIAEAQRAERALLADLLRNNQAVADVLLLPLREGNFSTDQHRRVWSAIVAVWQAGKPATVVTVGEELHRRGAVEDIGGYGFLGELLNGEPTGAHALSHAAVVRDRALLRGLAWVAVEAMRCAEQPTGPAEQMIALAESRLFALAEPGLPGGGAGLGETLDEVSRAIDDRCMRRGPEGLSTGFTELDNHLSGLRPGELIMAAARPGVGKTGWAVWVAADVAVRQRRAVLFVSLEQSRQEVAERLMCAAAGVEGRRVRRGVITPDEARCLAAASNDGHDARLRFEDRPGQSVLQVAAHARRLKHGAHGLDLIILDYLQLLEPEDRRAKRYEQVGAFSRALKKLARELSVPVLALSQLNRGAEERANQRPRLSDLRESGDLEQDSDVVLLLNRGQRHAAGGWCEIEANVAKNRNGPTGDVSLAYDPACGRFAEMHDSAFAGKGGRP
jgi:replicative DNA helicase